MTKYEHPGLVDSSYTVFTLIGAVFVAYSMTGVFSDWSRPLATICIYLCFLYYMVFFSLIKQFENTDFVFAYYITAMLVFPGVTGFIIDRIVGPLHGGVVPVIAGFGFLGRYNVYIDAYPSVFFQYGAFAFIGACFIGMFFEVLYIHFMNRTAASKVRAFLLDIDESIDSNSTKLSDKLFFETNLGFLFGVGLLIVHAVLIYIVASMG